MTNFEKHITKAGESYKLSADERAKMSRVVREYMTHKPLARAEMYSVSVSYRWFSFAHRPLAAALVLVLVFGSGVSYAAENALPGDALYSVKTYVNEPARLALASSAEAKAEIQIEFAERRIEEATVLAAEGRLDEDTEGQLAAAFESHAAAAAEHIAEADTDDSSASVELSSRFENRLAAHENVLAEVEAGREDEDAPHSARLAEAIHIASMNVINVRAENAIALAANIAADVTAGADASIALATDTNMEAQAKPMPMPLSIAAEAPNAPETNTRSAKFAANVAPTPAPDAKTILRMKTGAEKSLKAAQKSLKNAKSLSAEAHAKAEADIAFADSRLTDGSAFLEADADADAFGAFEESLRVSEQANVYIKAAPTLEKARARVKNFRSATDVRANVTVPDAAINATVTLPIIPAKKVSDHPKEQDANDESNTDDNAEDPKKNEDESPTLKLLNKLNISF